MSSQGKIRVAVLFGGRSAEHEVSLRSANNVIHHLDTSLFDVIPIGINKTGTWFLGQEVFEKSISHQEVPHLATDQTTWFAPEWINTAIEKKQIQKTEASLSSTFFDVVFPAVHGTYCEDGTLQGLLELANIPYVGCGVLASAIGMDKDVSKRLVMQAGIAVAPYLVIKKDEWLVRAPQFSHQVSEQLSYPVFVKPANTGSSIGINKVKSEQGLQAAIDEAFRFDTKVIIEKALEVFELEVAVMESLESAADPIVSLVGEIKPRHEFYSYDAKYLDENGAELLIPAPISAALSEKVRDIAKRIFKVLECNGMARVDLFLDKNTNQIYFNEINTLPGFTTISMFPKLMMASGMRYAEILTHLIHLALKKFRDKKQLIFKPLEFEEQ